jgi:hypothetical protein
LAAGIFCTTFSLFEKRREHAEQSDDEADAEQRETGYAPERGVSG